MENLLTLKEAAEILGYSEDGLRELARRRAITFAKPAGRYRFKREWLEEFIEAGTVPATKKSSPKTVVPPSTPVRRRSLIWGDV